MKFKVIVSGTLLVLLGASVVWAGDPWKEKPWTEWTEKDVKRILDRSPWASEKRIDSLAEPWERDPGPFPEIRRRRITIRWLSSLTQREAVVRRMQLQGRTLDAEQVKRVLSPLSEYYAVAVFGTTASELASLESHSKQSASPLTVKRKYDADLAYLKLQQSKKRISPVTVVPIGEGPLHSVAHLLFSFPRQIDGKRTIGPDEEKVTFVWEVGKRKIKQAFDLRKMVRDGKPDL
jgi:hypothetical protein